MNNLKLQAPGGTKITMKLSQQHGHFDSRGVYRLSGKTSKEIKAMAVAGGYKLTGKRQK